MSVHVDPAALPGRFARSDLRAPCHVEPAAEVVRGADTGGWQVTSSQVSFRAVLPHSTS